MSGRNCVFIHLSVKLLQVACCVRLIIKNTCVIWYSKGGVLCQVYRANQAHVHRYKNLKRKLRLQRKYIFNEECLRQKLIPNDAKFQIPNALGTSDQT